MQRVDPSYRWACRPATVNPLAGRVSDTNKGIPRSIGTIAEAAAYLMLPITAWLVSCRVFSMLLIVCTSSW